MSDRTPKKFYFFEDPADPSKALCLECFGAEQRSPDEPTVKPVEDSECACHACRETLVQAALRKYRQWRDMGTGAVAAMNLAPQLRDASKAAYALATELTKQQRDTTSFEELSTLYLPLLHRHQVTWDLVCRAVAPEGDTVTDKGLRAFGHCVLMPTLERFLSRFCVVTSIDRIPWRRIFGRRTSYPTSPVHILSAPMTVTAETLWLNPFFDFGPIGPGDAEIHVAALFKFAAALEVAESMAQAYGHRIKADEGRHAWEYLMNFIDDYGIAPKSLSHALCEAGLETACPLTIAQRISSRLTQVRKKRAREEARMAAENANNAA